MDKSNQILSDLVVFNKYAKYVAGEERRETWEEIVDRYINIHFTKKLKISSWEVRFREELN